MTSRQLVWLIELGLIGLMLIAYWIPLPADWVRVLQDSIYVIAPIFAVVGGSMASYHFGTHGERGRTLVYITIGLAAWCVGEMLWVSYELLGWNPYPSLADVFYLAAYPLLFIGLMQQTRSAHKRFQELDGVRLFLLGLVAMLLGAAVVYFGVYQAYQPDRTVLENLVGIFYGVGDLVLIVSTLLLLITAWDYRGGKLAEPWMIFCLGLLLTLLADIIFAAKTDEYTNQVAWYKPTLDSLWILGYILYGHALLQLAHTITEVQRRLRSIAP